MIYPEPAVMRSPDLSAHRAQQTFQVHIVLPAYNEADGLGEMLRDLDRTLGDAQFRYEINVVDDGSADDTAEVVLEAATRIPVRLISHDKNRGLAAAIRTGLTDVAARAAACDVIVTMDSDNTHPIGLIPRMIGQIHEGRDVVVASRFRRGARVMGVSAYRQVTSIVASLMFKTIFYIPGVRDYTCGYRVYRADVLQRALEIYGDDFVSEQGFTCMVDILLKLSRMRLIFGELPMILRYDKKVGASKMPVAKTIQATLKLAAKRRLGIMN